jgi:ubiquinone/menaquinone biosynthesis C-methylase UbiE
MANMVCPPWIGYLLLNPLRKWLENPEKILGPFIEAGMTVLEPGCGMGFFTLPLAEMVGSDGRVLAVDIQPKMLSALEKRARKKGLMDRIILREARPEGLGIDDHKGMIDLCAAIHMVHEVPDSSVFFKAVWEALKPGGKLLVIEPKGHVKADQFEETIKAAEDAGFELDPLSAEIGSRKALLTKPSA